MRTVCGLAPLHYAVCGNHDAAVVELLRHEPCITSGSSFTAYDLCVMPDNGSTPLHFAAFKGRLNPALAILRFYVSCAGRCWSVVFLPNFCLVGGVFALFLPRGVRRIVRKHHAAGRQARGRTDAGV